MMKQQNFESHAEWLHEFPKVKRFLKESLKFYQKEATAGGQRKRLHEVTQS